MIKDLKPLIGKLAKFAKYRMGFSHPPKLFLKQDNENAKSCFGRTAHYDPGEKSITIFVTGRHPKDVLRSLAHELVHHTQNLRGDLAPEKCGGMSDKYAQENPHMRKMEEEAYLVGNMCFRDWEDSEKFSLAESKILKENKTMTKKVTKESLKEMIRSILEEKMKEEEEIEEKTKRDGHQIVGRPVPDDRVKPLEEDGDEEEGDEEEGDCPSVEEAVGANAENDNEESLEEGDEEDPNTDLDGTPERETSLYEARFAKRNASLFEDLVKKWAK